MAHSGDDAIPLLSGSTPGLLDSSQRSRLLRTATCSLFFATFDPHSARADVFPNISGLSINPKTSSHRVAPETAASTDGKRIVIETDPESGTCTWRFVPRAKVEGESWGGEGPWPRVVALNGLLVRMTQDQWDIHKLDPLYDCVVQAPPNLTTITRTPNTTTAHHAQTPDYPATPTATPRPRDGGTPPKVKRGASSTFQKDEAPKKQKTSFADSDWMVIDEDVSFPSTPPWKASTKEDMGSRKRRSRLERSGNTSASDSTPLKSKTPGKRTGSSVFANLSFNSPSGSGEVRDTPDIDMAPSRAKKSRTRSPDTVRREIDQKRMERERKRKADMDARLKARRDALREAFWKDIGVIPFDEEPLQEKDEAEESETSADDERSNGVDESSSECDHEDDAERIAKIEESRRKLAELEKDKPLWEESARRRQQNEMKEELRRKREKTMWEEEKRSQERRSAMQKLREERLEQDRREHERQARIREQGRRMFIAQSRDVLRWNTRLALERYTRIAADFDAAKFAAGERPMGFAQVPWPVLHASFSVQDIDWDTVEKFFAEVQRFMWPPEFKELVEKSHKRFHPDRWRSRGLLMSVRDETERDLLEVAGSTVAQALTPLWKKVTGRSEH